MVFVRYGKGWEVSIDGRAAAMVRYIVEHASRLNGEHKVRLEFNCAGKVIKPKMQFFEDGQPIRVE